MALLLLALSCFARPDGCASNDELGRLFRLYSDQRDEQKLRSLVYWSGVRQQERDGSFHSLRHDLTYRLQKVEFVPLEPNVKFEYVAGGVTFRPSSKEPPELLLVLPTNSGVVRSSQYHRDNNAVEELSILRHKE